MDNLISSFDIAIITKKEILLLENLEMQLQKGTLLMGNDGKRLLYKVISFFHRSCVATGCDVRIL